MRNPYVVAVLAAGTVLAASQAFCITPAGLERLLARHEPVTVVDIRSPAEFAATHIPGALNVPAPLLPRKRLPGLGRVVVCGDGLRPGEAAEAVAALNRMAGIQAEALEGGIGAWEDSSFASTREPGMKPEKLRYVTYREVEEAAAGGTGVVLVDLRGPAPEAPGRIASRRARDSASGLAGRFPGASEVRPARERRPDGREHPSTSDLPRTKDPRRVYVLVDDGNGDAETMARRIRAAGLGQVVILAGGAEALAREGRPGLRTREFGGPK
jgi:rhodanese-related sulfurtransferase